MLYNLLSVLLISFVLFAVGNKKIIYKINGYLEKLDFRSLRLSRSKSRHAKKFTIGI